MAQPTQESGSPATEMASFGNVAIRMGYITQAQIEECMKVQAAAQKAGLRKRLGEILIKKGYLTPEQFQQVLKGQTAGRKRVGAYELISKLGEGGMGSVFKARQVYMDRLIALKILAPKMAKNKDFRDRFVREARAVAKLNHPHIVAGIDVGSADGYCYFAMEFVDGESLGEYMHRKGILDPGVAIEFTRQMAMALHHAHQNNLLHRDVKPDNVLLDSDHKIAKLADLGLARSAASAVDDAALTQAGQAVGTPFYMSPEQARGLADVTPATDFYSLGATLYHLLTGHVPFDGPTAAVIMTRHLTDAVPSPRQSNPKVPAALDKICMKMMQKKPEDRYTSGQALVKDIENWQADQGSNENLDVAPVMAYKEKAKAPRTNIPNERPPERESNAGSGSTVNTRSFRRKQEGKEVMVGVTVLACVMIVLLALYAVSRPSKPLPKSPTPQPVVHHVVEPPPTPLPSMQFPIAEPAIMKTEGNRRVFLADFETGNAPNFDIDPLFVNNPPETVAVISDKDGKNHVMKLARIRHRDWACMARLMLPADLQLSAKTELSFFINFNAGTTNDPTPEVHIQWDRIIDGQRAIGRWLYSNANYKTQWVQVRVPLNDPATITPMQHFADRPQYVIIYAGKTGKAGDVYMDDFQISDPPAEAAAPAPDNPKETPVAPPPSNK